MRGKASASLEFPVLMFWCLAQQDLRTLFTWESQHKLSRTADLYCQVHKLQLSCLPKFKCRQGHKKLTEHLLYPSAP